MHHPNILTFMGFVEELERVMIITNFVDGLNLFDLLHSNKKVCALYVAPYYYYPARTCAARGKAIGLVSVCLYVYKKIF